jgi:hypothetical protein
MSEPSDTGDQPFPRVYTLRETFKRLNIGQTAGREWIALYELLTAPLPRAGDKVNAARLVTDDVIKAIQAARTIITQNPGAMTAEDALRRVLGLREVKLEVAQPFTPNQFAAAVRAELEPLLEKMQSMENELRELRQELKVLPPSDPVQQQQTTNEENLEARALPGPKLEDERPRSWLDRILNRRKL